MAVVVVAVTAPLRVLLLVSMLVVMVLAPRPGSAMTAVLAVTTRQRALTVMLVVRTHPPSLNQCGPPRGRLARLEPARLPSAAARERVK